VVAEDGHGVGEGACGQRQLLEAAGHLLGDAGGREAEYLLGGRLFGGDAAAAHLIEQFRQMGGIAVAGDEAGLGHVVVRSASEPYGDRFAYRVPTQGFQPGVPGER
jgi:hypothetical protein